MELMDIEGKVPFSREEVAAWHERSGAMRRLMPTWQQITINREPWPIENGVQGGIQVGLGPFSMTWQMELEEVRPGHGFVDRQIKGPFAAWRHEHAFEDCEIDGHPGCLLRDRVRYRLPGGFVGKVFGGGKIKRDLDAMFKVSCFMFHVVCFTFHVFHFMFHGSWLISHTPRFTFHVSCFLLHVLCFMFQSCLTVKVSLSMAHMRLVTFHG